MASTSSSDALDQALLNLREALDESGADVTRDELPMVIADEMQLIQLFQNLIGNGVKYQPDRSVPRIHVSATSDGLGGWKFSVSDNGIGIAAEHHERIFGMFQRLHGRDEFAGTGIGLAICRKIVERHGGSLSVTSTPMEGATFSFRLRGIEAHRE